MNYSAIHECSIENGPGCRTSLFVSGCRIHCPGCHNASAWDFDSGKPFTQETLIKIVELTNNPWCDGLSILGGEPLDERNIDEVLHIVSAFKWVIPDKNIWLYTGYKMSDLVRNMEESPAYYNTMMQILFSVDVLVDGPYVIAQKDVRIPFRGSTNQRIIDLKETLGKDCYKMTWKALKKRLLRPVLADEYGGNA